jgi:multisubunit Na+/H+ antiporter MnhE subunit
MMQTTGARVNFVEGIICIWNTLEENPLLHSCRHKARNIRWRYLVRFLYRVVCEVVEAEHAVIVAAMGPRLGMNENGGDGYEAT